MLLFFGIAGDGRFLAAADPAAPLAIGFRIDNLEALLNDPAVDALLLRDEGSSWPGDAFLQVEWFHVYPAVGLPGAPAEAGVAESRIFSDRIGKTANGFSLRLALPRPGDNPLPPGDYRVEISFFKSQKGEVRERLRSGDPPSRVGRAFSIGDCRRRVSALSKEAPELRKLMLQLNDLAAGFQAKVPALFTKPFDGTGPWNDLTQDLYLDLQERVARLESAAQSGVMTDMTAMIAYCYRLYQTNNVGSMYKRLAGGNPEECKRNFEASRNSHDAWIDGLGAEVLVTILDGHYLREIPLHLGWSLRGALAEMSRQYIAAAGPAQDAAARRAAVDVHWREVFQIAESVLATYDGIYTAGYLQNIREGMGGHSEWMAAMKADPDENVDDCEWLLQNLQAYLDALNGKGESAPELLRAHLGMLAGYRDYCAELLAAAEEAGDYEGVADQLQKTAESLERESREFLPALIETLRLQVAVNGGDKVDTSEPEGR